MIDDALNDDALMARVRLMDSETRQDVLASVRLHLRAAGFTPEQARTMVAEFEQRSQK